MPLLHWLNRDEHLKIAGNAPYRILEEDETFSFGDKDLGNLIVQGDNLEALKALLPFYAGQVKCIYIDPPYNTGAAFEHYDDNLEHSKWLEMMYPRLKILREFLREDGYICCHIDDSEGQYLRILLDEIFGRNNYLSSMYIRVRYAEKTLKQDMIFHKQIEQIYIYRKSYGSQPNLNKKEKNFDKFNYFIKEKSKGTEITLGNKKVVIFNSNDYEICKQEGSATGLKEIWASGTILDGNSSGRFFRDYLTGRYKEDGYGVLYKVYGIGDDSLDYRYFTGPKKQGATKGKYYQGVPIEQLKSGLKYTTTPIENFLDLAGNFGNCRHEGGVNFRSGKKPEVLIGKILNHFSNKGDIVLDSFLGSGTTCAVAQKMDRKYIGIEMGEHAKTLCVPRLKKVIEGTDQGGISKAQNWQGGGGFRFFKLGAEIFDEYGQINPNIKFNQLANHIYFTETYTPITKLKKGSTLLGLHEKTAYSLLYNGILHDKSVNGGNVLTYKTLDVIKKDIGEGEYDKIVIYGECSRISKEKLKSLNIEFKQTPYDVKAR